MTSARLLYLGAILGGPACHLAHNALDLLCNADASAAANVLQVRGHVLSAGGDLVAQVGELGFLFRRYGR